MLQKSPPVANPTGLAPNTGYGFGGTPSQSQAIATPFREAIQIDWPQYPSAGGQLLGRCPAVVGEPIDITTRIAGSSWRVARCPATPKGWQKNLTAFAFDGRRFIARVPGLFALEHEVDGYRKSIEIVAVTADMLGVLQLDDAHAQRHRLRSVCRDPRITTESIVDALEAHDFDGGKTFSRLLGSATSPFRASDFGA